jgi:catalase
MADWYDRNGEDENDHYTQAGWLYNKAMNDYDRHNLISNIIGAMSGISGPKKDIIVNRQLCHFFRADARLGAAIAQGLGVNVEAVMAEIGAAHSKTANLQPA